MSKTLKDLVKYEKGIIRDVCAGHPLSERLLELGLMPGEPVELVHEAPVSRDPIVVHCAGTRLALRRSEAELVILEDEAAHVEAAP